MSIEGLGPSQEEIGLDPEESGLKDGSENKEKRSDGDKNPKEPWAPDKDVIKRIQGAIESL